MTAPTVGFTVFGRRSRRLQQVLPVKVPGGSSSANPAKARPWAMHVAAAARDAHYTTNLIAGPVAATITFDFACPGTRTGRNLGTLRVQRRRR